MVGATTDIPGDNRSTPSRGVPHPAFGSGGGMDIELRRAQEAAAEAVANLHTIGEEALIKCRMEAERLKSDIAESEQRRADAEDQFGRHVALLKSEILEQNLKRAALEDQLRKEIAGLISEIVQLKEETKEQEVHLKGEKEQMEVKLKGENKELEDKLSQARLDMIVLENHLKKEEEKLRKTEENLLLAQCQQNELEDQLRQARQETSVLETLSNFPYH
mmetsp:Transcript_9874/g.20867  ORF Transcript_9874/g.20867 Transcript_9874/m.20867 type:complete len:219 (-) Transcript_9874:36-692(-)